MLGIFFAQALHRMRRYFAAFLFEAARLALFASMRAYHRGLLNRHLLYDAMRVSSALNHFAFFIAFGARLKRRRRNRP
jgi:hypothetical protein